ncbi:hypothetical protein [Caproiciproducens sp. CPB-2]|uniref:hypothetical protein n=1 Tax=Caproiciproducens sp. CPB-2 TaxID=3030017 RepID=UPI0023DA230E|nr:hypothetical protein [Caproiciproducens sp. CPB-2]MDF1495202.1 hypothetical protein [Caproiciproducens sp. CPB-2]
MNHTEVANTLETVYGWHKEDDIPITIAALQAAADERKIASGEYAPVVHCKDCDQWHDNYCDTFSADVEPDFSCANGAIMGGKGGDIHAK